MYEEVYKQMKYYLDEGVSKNKIISLTIEDFNDYFIQAPLHRKSMLEAMRDFLMFHNIPIPLKLNEQMMEYELLN